MFDLITIGDSVVDTFVSLTEAEISVVDGERKLILPYGEKVPTEVTVDTVGGNAANAAVGSSRLKLKTAIYTIVGNAGDDRDDDRIKRKLKKEGVDISYLIETEDCPSTHHIILSFKGERTILTYHQPWKYELPDFDLSKWIYFSSVAPSFSKSNLIPQLISYLERSGARLLYSPGTFQIKYGVKKYPRLLSLTELFIVNLEEAMEILEYRQKAPIKKLLKSLSDLGPRRVVITDGMEGSYGFDGSMYYHMKVFPAKVVQNTGAGDGYACATLAALFYGKDLSEAMRWGAANGASVVEGFGSQEKLLSYAGMMEKLKTNLKPEII